MHIIYSFGKDFGLNGTRISCLLTHNKELMLRMQQGLAYASISNSTADMIEYIIKDDEFVSK